MRRTILAAAFVLAVPAWAMAQSVNVSVNVDTAKPGAEISRHIYGHFVEHLGRGIYEGIWVGQNSKIPNIRGYRSDVVAALKKNFPEKTANAKLK